MAEIKTSAQLDSALRRAFSDAGLRPQPQTRMTDVIAALNTMGIEVGIQDGVLTLQQGITQFNTSLALRNFAARPEHQTFFVQSNENPAGWSLKEKAEFLKTHSPEEYERRLRAPVLNPQVHVLDANMSRADYANLTLQERNQFITEFGVEGVTQVMRKPK